MGSFFKNLFLSFEWAQDPNLGLCAGATGFLDFLERQAAGAELMVDAALRFRLPEASKPAA